MSQKREYIQSRKRTLLESQQQAQAAAAASQPALPQPISSAAAPVPSSAAPPAFTAPTGTDTSAHMYGAGAGAATHLATSQPTQSGLPGYPGSTASQTFPTSTPGYGSHMPFQPGAPYPPRMAPTVPGGQRFPGMPRDTSAYPQANAGSGAPRPGLLGARLPLGAGQIAAAGNSTEKQKGFEQYGDGEDGATGSQFLHGVRPPFEAAGGRPPFGQRFPGPRPGAPNEFGMQAPFQPNQPRAGLGQMGLRPGFGPRPDMYAKGSETAAGISDVTESGDLKSSVAGSQIRPGFADAGFGRGMLPGGPGMGPRLGFPRGPRPMGMMPRQQAPGVMEGMDENAEQSGEWLGDEMPPTSGVDFRPRGIRPEGSRFPPPAFGFPGRGDIRGPLPGVGDPRLLRPGDPRAAMQGGLRPRVPGLPCPPWLAGAGRGEPQWGQNFEASATDEEYNEDVENEEGNEEDVGQEEGFGEEYEGDEGLEQGGGFGSAGFGPRGFPHPPFGAMPPRFGMERPCLDMRGPLPGFGPRGPGFGAGLRPRTGPVPLMDIRVRPPSSSQPEEPAAGQEDDENVEGEETEGFAEESNEFEEQADAAISMGARMPFRPPFPPGLRGMPASQRLRHPGSMLAAPPRPMAGPPGGRWPRPGFGERPMMERPPGPGFRGLMLRFPRMPGQQFDSDPNTGYYPEGGGFDTEAGFGDVSEEDYLAAEAEQWGEQQPSMEVQTMKSGNAADASEERYACPTAMLELSEFT